MPKTGHFILHNNFIPTTTAGKYELITMQDGLPFTVTEEHTHVTVAAPRYTMPTEQILSTFPPANAEGAFADRLPQIVLKRRTLPWERNPAGLPAPSTKPWLALVVVAEGEAELSAATEVAKCVTPGTVLLDPADKDVEQGLYLTVTETVRDKIFPCEEDLELLVHVREVDVNDTELANGDDDGWLAVVLANRLPVYDVANDRPVRYMACLINVEGQLANLPTPKPFRDDFEFELAQDWSVLATAVVGPDPLVMGGGPVLDQIALPPIGGLASAGGAAGAALAPLDQAKERGAVFVGSALDGAANLTETTIASQWKGITDKVAAIALDPDAKRLVRDTMAAGWHFPIGLYTLERTFQFPVLAHWSFTTNGGDSFDTLMKRLDVGLLGSEPEPKPVDPSRPAPPPPSTPKPEVVGTGHIGLDLRTRRGDRGRAWYRGPLVPFPTARDQPVDGRLPLAHSADQIRPVVPDGREDLALSAAFEIGRLLGLSQLTIVSALLRFRNEQFGAGRARELISKLSPFAIPELVAERVDFSRFMAFGTIEQMAADPGTFIGPRRPVADPGRELDVGGDLDAVIASGLGLDVEVVRNLADRVGIVAALTATEPPIGSSDGRIQFDEVALAGLTESLHVELNRVIDAAAPTFRVDRPVGAAAGSQPGGRRAGRQRDALDRLIRRAEAAADENGEEDQP